MIYVEDELIKLNGVVLPGLVKSIEVIETAKVDEQEVEGSATKPKQATGYEDAKVNIELIIDDTPSELWEYIPQTITAKSGSSSGSSSGSGKSGGGAASNLKADYKSYLSNERGKSPARDDADATAAMNKVTAMPY